MNITILAVGKLKEKYLQAGCAEYIKRMSSYAKLKVIEVADEKDTGATSEAEEKIILQKETERLLPHLKKDTYLIALAIEGKQLSSEELSEKIFDLALEGKSDLTFVIGGSLGLSNELLARADFKLSFSKMTFPHQLMRMILLEQIYRAFKINRGEPYHK